jgi:hypothetical protein
MPVKRITAEMESDGLNIVSPIPRKIKRRKSETIFTEFPIIPEVRLWTPTVVA